MRRVLLLAVLVVQLFAIGTSLRAQTTPAAPPVAEAKKPTAPAGLWLGVLKVGPINLRLAYDIQPVKDKPGEYTCTFISIDQGMVRIPVKKTTFTEGKLTLDQSDVGIRFEGQLNAAGTVITGEFAQGELKIELILKPIDKLPTLVRPQTPKAPFEYVTENVTFENAVGKIKLAGTITKPKGDGPFPVVVMVSGSGPQDRDETLFGHKPFLVIADALAKKGIACLRYDDRGVGASGGSQADATTGDLATDAAAAVKFLHTRPEFDKKRVGICGHSEGGMIAPMIAAESPELVGFIILLAGPGVSGEAILREQTTDFSRLAEPKTTDAEIEDFLKAVLPIMKSNVDTKTATVQLKKAIQELVEKEKDPKKKEQGLKNLDAAAGKYAEPWLRWFVKYDPAPTLLKVKCPVLAINGQTDQQVKPKANLEAIRKGLAAAGNKEVTITPYPGLNHLFQESKTGDISEYGQIEQTIAPAVLEQLSTWILARK
ncbi:MAG: alpha/beta hydrolase family protein [Gemmataceae bacterium]